MTREMMKQIREHKAEANTLIRYANPNVTNKPSDNEILDILIKNIPYRVERPTIEKFEVMEYSKNRIIVSAHYKVKVSSGETYAIDAYKDLCGRTSAQKEEDKTADFPSGLFKIFYTKMEEA